MEDTTDQPTTIVESLEHLAQQKPDKPAFVFFDKNLNTTVLTRQQLWKYCQKFAAALKRKGLGKGDVFCNTLGNSAQRMVTEFGVVTAGAIAMNGQISKADGSDFIYSLNIADVNAVIFDSEEPNGILSFLKPKLEHYDEKTGRVSCPEVPSLKYILDYPLKNKKRFFEDLDKEEDMVHVDITPDDVCLYLSTSGSTSFYKSTAFNSKCILSCGKHLAGCLDIVEDDLVLNTRGLGWLSGYPTLYVATGTARLLLDMSHGWPKNFPETQWKAIVQERCTVGNISPYVLSELKDIRENSVDDELRSYKLRTVVIGGSPVTRNHVEAGVGNIADAVVITFGSTEAGFTCFTRMTTMDGYEEFNTGYPFVGTTVKVVDKEGKELPPEQKGEVLVHPRQKALYYVKEPAKTSETFLEDGWVRLGDIGMIGAKGQLFVYGRDKFAIQRQSVVFYPDAIESFIRGCPGVKEVAVTAVPDEMQYEQICALIIKQQHVQLSADDVVKYCEASIQTFGFKALAPVPDHILFVDSIPLNATGKLKRNDVRKQACGLLALDSAVV